jgi:hypothetical protein
LIKFTHKGSFKKTERFFKRIGEGDYLKGLNYFGEAGLSALYDATPKRTGKTAASWTYSIENTKDGLTITWFNSNVVNGMNIAILIQKGHGTASGYYVQGVDYINPALAPIFDLIGKNLWMEVTKNA